VIGFGLIGWLAPSSIPLINGNSLTGLFFSSIGEELAHFPSPPALQSQFWSEPLAQPLITHAG
jgi:photosystem I subunit PsaO